MKKKIAVVTGGNRGIGLEVCRQLAKKDIHVILTSRSEVRGRKAVRELNSEGLDVTFFKLDVTNDKDIKSLVKFIEKEYGRVDILVNNAGILADSSLREFASVFDADISKIQKTFETNTLAPLKITNVLLPLMKKNRYGRIIVISKKVIYSMYLNK